MNKDKPDHSSQEDKYRSIFRKTECLSEEMMWKYISKELSTKEQYEVEMHLNDCELCSDAMDGLMLLKNRPDNSLALKIDSMIAGQTGGSGSSGYGRIWLAAASVAIFISGTFLYFMYQQKEPAENLSMLEQKAEIKNPEIPVAQIPADSSGIEKVKAEPVKTVAEVKKRSPENIEREQKKPGAANIADKTTQEKMIISGEAETFAMENPLLKSIDKDNAPAATSYTRDAIQAVPQMYGVASTKTLLEKPDKNAAVQKPAAAETADDAATRNTEVLVTAESKNTKGKARSILKTPEESSEKKAEENNSGLKLYEQKNYAGANLYFLSSLHNNVQDSEARLYSGKCYYYLNQQDSAVDKLLPLIQNKDPKIVVEARWYLALSYCLKKETYSNARPILKLLIEEKKEYSKESEKKLKEIGNE